MDWSAMSKDTRIHTIFIYLYSLYLPTVMMNTKFVQNCVWNITEQSCSIFLNIFWSGDVLLLQYSPPPPTPTLPLSDSILKFPDPPLPLGGCLRCVAPMLFRLYDWRALYLPSQFINRLEDRLSFHKFASKKYTDKFVEKYVNIILGMFFNKLS